MWDTALEANVKANKADATSECKDFEEGTLEVEGFISSLSVGRGVIRSVLVFMPFLGVEV